MTDIDESMIDRMKDDRTVLEIREDRVDDALLTLSKGMGMLRGELTKLQKLMDRILNPTPEEFMEGHTPERLTVWRGKDSEEFKGKLDNLSAFRGQDPRETEG